MPRVNITLDGSEESTGILMDVTKPQLNFLHKLAQALNDEAETIPLAPMMSVKIVTRDS